MDSLKPSERPDRDHEGSPLVWNEFLTSSGRRIHVDDVHIARTYAGLVEGSPDDAFNGQLVEKAKRAMEALWGKRATYLVPPKVTLCTEIPWRPYNRLPELRYHAWLTSDPADASGDGSELVLIWFGTPAECREKSILEVVQAAANEVDWKVWARDFRD